MDIRARSMDGGMDHKGCLVQEGVRPRLGSLNRAIVVDEDEVLRLDQGEVLPLENYLSFLECISRINGTHERVNPEAVGTNGVLRSVVSVEVKTQARNTPARLSRLGPVGLTRTVMCPATPSSYPYFPETDISLSLHYHSHIQFGPPKSLKACASRNLIQARSCSLDAN